MLREVTMFEVKLPKLYMAETEEDTKQAMKAGLPFVKWEYGMESLLKELLRPTLEKMFPHILWDNVLGKRKVFESLIVNSPGGKEFGSGSESYRPTKNDDESFSENVSIATDYREFDRCGTIGGSTKLDIETYVGDLSSSVNIEVLQELNMMPSFVGDIVDCIRINLSNNMKWREGYNKRLGSPVGTFGNNRQLPNLIILDVSGSIPRGISATMLTLIDTMRTQLAADLIITGDISKYYPHGTKLPSPQELRDEFDYNNETYMFARIIKHNISNKEWGHVISFGDYDSPNSFKVLKELKNCKVHAVHNYHTKELNKFTGYAQWTRECNPDEITYDCSWCDVIKY